MSRMTKFLKQKCQVEPYKLGEDSEPETNRFGELIYEDPVTCKCRHEVCFQDILTTNGSTIRSEARYFLDETMEIKADYRIDGHVVLTVEAYIGPAGETVGYEVYVA